MTKTELLAKITELQALVLTKALVNESKVTVDKFLTDLTQEASKLDASAATTPFDAMITTLSTEITQSAQGCNACPASITTLRTSFDTLLAASVIPAPATAVVAPVPEVTPVAPVTTLPAVVAPAPAVIEKPIEVPHITMPRQIEDDALKVKTTTDISLVAQKQCNTALHTLLDAFAQQTYAVDKLENTLKTHLSTTTAQKEAVAESTSSYIQRCIDILSRVTTDTIKSVTPTVFNPDDEEHGDTSTPASIDYDAVAEAMNVVGDSTIDDGLEC